MRDDWFGFALPGSAADIPTLRQTTGGLASGSKSVLLPATLAPATYEVRLFTYLGVNNSSRLATSPTFSVITATAPSVTVDKSTVGYGETYTLRYSGFPAGTVVVLGEAVAQQTNTIGTFTINGDPYFMPLSIPPNQPNTNRSVSPVLYTYISTVGAAHYDVTVLLKP